MKCIITAVACVVSLFPAISHADGMRGHYSGGHSGASGWELLGAAVVGGIIVHAAERNAGSRTVTSSQAEKPVLVNGVWMQRVLRCYQEIVTDYRGDERIVNQCNYVYVPVQVLER